MTGNTIEPIVFKRTGASPARSVDDIYYQADDVPNYLRWRSPYNTLFVSPGFINHPGPYYQTIQAAINAASSGDTIIVYAGSYDERLNTRKSLSFFFMPGAVLAPSTDSATSLFDINVGGSTLITVNIDGMLTISYNAATYTPKWLDIGKAVVHANIRSFEGAAGTGGEVIKVDSISAYLYLKLGTSDDGKINIDDAARVHIEADTIDELRLNNAEVYVKSDRIIGTIDVDGGTNYIEQSHILNNIDIDGGTTHFRDCEIKANYNGHLIDIENDAASAKFYGCRIQNENTTITNTCINMSGAAGINPVILAHSILIKNNGTYTITGTGDVDNWSTIASHTHNITGSAGNVGELLFDINVLGF